MRMLKGIPAAGGIAIGPTFIYRPVVISVERHAVADTEAEIARFHAAVERSKEQLAEVLPAAETTVGPETAAIFEAHQMFLEDPALMDIVEGQIRGGQNAEAALTDGINQFASMLASLEDDYLRERAADVQDVGQRVLRALAGVEEKTLASINSTAIVIAQDLAPSDTAQMNRDLVLGFCTATGGTTSHTAILARMIGLPAVVGAGEQLLEIQDGEIIILDGSTREVIVGPNEATLNVYRNRRAAWLVLQGAAKDAAQLPAETMDGQRFEMVANIGDAASAKGALEFGAEGVGLYRTEFLFLDRAKMPDEEEQYHAYLEVAKVMGKRPVIVRTLDIGGDKQLPYLNLGQEQNPFLGCRAIRICLARPELFKTQLCAILRAGAGYNLKIMLPMIATLSEIRQAKQILEEARQELAERQVEFAQSIDLGIMVEIPSAAITADLLAPEVDFFSIGTNDLTQYTLACDRTNAQIASLYDHLHPSVLRLIKNVIENGHRFGKWVGVCGEMAGDLEAIPILVGLGLDEFSMSAATIPAAKNLIRQLDSALMSDLADRALSTNAPDRVRSLVRAAVHSEVASWNVS